ncbi:PTS sugar transporter subunit IIA [Alicyclobacillus ferrooxydans]|uniref:PTS EIIA type-2 domain-containing protein n=1 Tax=Alicyclobacillus ferrooxydans TaxID=471514 RepID=A0A0P9D2J8_9BACL|nr:fructose PTS transporter subunit IIA [Alicyclobacillus ferrooxydans]KPV43742.1 hypothetical protein AN477_10125 [Alicyclobacillus ferrooxydans]
MIDEQFAMFHVPASTQREAIETLVKEAARLGRVRDEKVVVESVLQREEEGTTGFGKGIAIPHGKSDGVIEPTLMYGRLDTKIDWKSMDDAPVDKLFLILVPESSHAEHLQMLAKLARKLMHDEFVEALEGITERRALADFLKAELQ